MTLETECSLCVAQVGKEKFDKLEDYLASNREWSERIGRKPVIFNKMNGKGRNTIVMVCPRTCDGVKRKYEAVNPRGTVLVQVQVQPTEGGKVGVQMSTRLEKTEFKKGPDHASTGAR